MQKNSIYTMQALVPLVDSFFEENKKVIITAVGNSMRPLIRHSKDGIILERYKGHKLSCGDMVFYKRDNNRYVLHRIVDIDDNGNFTMLGDNQTEKEAGIRPDQIFAVPTAVIRGNKTVSVKSAGYKCYAKFWTKSKVFRRLSIFLFEQKIKIARIIKGKKVSAE